MRTNRIDLIEDVIEQIKRDINDGDETAIYEMLTFLSDDVLENYLCEE